MAKSNKTNLAYVLYALLAIVLGVLFIVYKTAIIGTVLQIGFTVIGVALIVLGILNMIGAKKLTLIGILEIAAGVVIIVFGWVAVQIAVIVGGVVLILYNVVALFKGNVKGLFGVAKFVLGVIVGVALILGKLNLDWLFVVIGVLLIVYGIALFCNTYKK